MKLNPERLRSFATDLLVAYGVDTAQARVVADNLVWNEMVGRRNFGFLRLPLYVERLAAGGLNGDCRPRFDERGEGIAMLDGDNGFGQYAGALAMDHAIGEAVERGTGIVGVRNSNFFGSGAWFVDKAASRGMIGLALSNSFPKVVAHGGLLPVFGTNPFAFGAPRRNGDHILVDMATSALAGSTVRQHKRTGEPLPVGLAIDGDGNPVTDPNLAEKGALLPFGGAKGYGLSLMVEILAGVLTGAGISGGVASMYRDLSEGGNNGHLMMAIDIERFMPLPVYYHRMEGLVRLIRASQPDGEVLLPGEVRWREYRDSRRNGIRLDPPVRKSLDEIAAAVGMALETEREPALA